MKRTFTQSEITIERIQGGWNLSVITDKGNRYRLRYLAYSRREALRNFSHYVRTQEQGA